MLPDWIIKIRPDNPAPGVWEAPNLYLLGKKTLILVDAGYQSEGSIKTVSEVIDTRISDGAELKYIILTHAHPDHSGGARILADKYSAQILAHEGENQLLSRLKIGVEPDLTIGDGYISEIAETKIRAVHTPGHTKGHLALYIEDNGVLLTGDLIVGTGTAVVSPPDGDMREYLASLKKVKDMATTMFLPGHGPLVEDTAAKVDEYIEHRLMREGQVVNLLKEGKRTPSEMVKVIYAEVHPALHRAAEATVMAHLNMLIEDGRVDEEPKGNFSLR